MRPVPFAVGWVFLMLAVILAAASISHDSMFFTLYAVTVHALCLEYRKSGLGN